MGAVEDGEGVLTPFVDELAGEVEFVVEGLVDDAGGGQTEDALGCAVREVDLAIQADESIESLIFWVGGVPKAKWDAAGGDTHKIPSLHSPYWAPDAEAVISTATEAMTVASLDVLKKG